MALVKTIDNAYELKEMFVYFNRDYFTIEGCEAIINYFDEIGGNTELDIIGICCDFTEESPEYIQDNYNNLDEIADAKNEDGEIDTDALLEALNDYTYAIELTNGNILYIAF